MRHIDDEKVASVIIECLNSGINSFVIYPYGKKGKRVKEILNEEFEIKELAVVDNKLVNDNENILSFDDLEEIRQDYVILLSSDNEEKWYEIRDAIKERLRDKVIDIAEIRKSEIRNGFSYMGKKMQIDTCSREQIRQIFEKTQTTWKIFGEKEPYWSVITYDEFKAQNINNEVIKRFYSDGWREIAEIISILRRNSIVGSWNELRKLDIVEIGCGCGRITKKLAGLFNKVTAVDISSGNLEIAKQAVKDKNVDFFLVTNIDDYRKISQTDVVYSYIVLQHNCPPVIEYMINSMLQCLKPRGIAIFQVPTYKRDYRFSYDDYMKEGIRTDRVEMHVFPQKRVFEIAYENGCVPLEVHPDNSTGQEDESRVFVFEKRCVEKEK